MELRLFSPPTVAEVPSAHLQEGEGQGVLTAPQQRFTFIQRFIVQCNTIDLGPKRELVRPMDGLASGLPGCQARGSAHLSVLGLFI